MKKLNTRSLNLGYYLAGLIEGKGNIYIHPKISNSLYKYIDNPRIEIAFHKNDLPFYENLKDILNTGSIYLRKNTLAESYTISNINKIIEIINLINGKFRTPKIIFLYDAIDHINLKYNLNITKLPLDNSDINSNAWLAGITDADGNFTISLEGKYGIDNYSSIIRSRVKCIYSIRQRIIDKDTEKSCIPFMTEIANLFQCNINYKSYNILTFLAQSNTNHHLIKSYFDKYPLMTSKYLDYLSFLEGLNYLGKHLTIKEIFEIQVLKNNMNDKRTYYNWDHLKNFYKFY